MQTEQWLNTRASEGRIDTKGTELRTPADRKKERDHLARVVSAWVSAGNRVTEVPFGLSVRSPDSVRATVQGITRKQGRPWQ